MSHQVTVKFEGLSIMVKTQCDQAISSMCKIDKTIEKIKKIASKVRNDKIIEYEKYLLEAKKKLTIEIESFKTMANSYTGNRMFEGEANKLREKLYIQAKYLIDVASELTGAKLAVIDQLVNEGLIDFIETSQQKILNEINGVKTYDESLVEKINNIEDISLRDLAFQQISNGVTNYDEIIKNSQIEYNRLLQRSSFVEDVQADLRNAGIPQNEINEIINKPINISNVSQIQVEVHSKIVDESIRKETLKVIIKSIRDRGFIVDTKKNLKIDREKNIVKLIAKKPDGKTAEFEISLNGKFMYHFDGYEGLACNQDINPFLEDLKNIYDINILHEEVHWSNPDKIQTQKYQYINTNKNKK